MGFDSAYPVNSRTPPHSVEAEEYLLSCCLIDGNDTVSLCIENKLTAAAFYAPANQRIYEKLIELYNRGTPIDLASLAEELKTSRQLDEIGGYAYLTQISGRIPTTAQAPYFAEKLRELYILRELIKVAAGAVESCYSYSGGLQDFVDRVERDIFAVTQERVDDGAKPVKQALAVASQSIMKMVERRGELTGLPTGFKDLDVFTYGLQKQEMIVLAARPSMGKTALALNIAEAAAMPKRGKGVGTLIFSLEMSAPQLAMRLVCARARVNLKLLRDGFLSKNGDELKRIKAAEDEIGNSPIYIDDASSPTVMEIRAKARRIHKRTPLGFIVVDYMQLVGAIDPRSPREQQVAEVSRGLKALAKELDLPVLVLSQLNRSSEKENRTPRLSDLRESGAIEQDADVVLMLARPKEAGDNFQVAADVADLVIAKQRNGPVGDMRLTFLKDITRFENFSP